MPPRGSDVALDSCERKATVWHGGLYIPGCDGGAVSVRQLQFESGKMIEASKFGQEEEEVDIELTSDEQKFPAHIKVSLCGRSMVNSFPSRDSLMRRKCGAAFWERVILKVQRISSSLGLDPWTSYGMW